MVSKTVCYRFPFKFSWVLTPCQDTQIGDMLNYFKLCSYPTIAPMTRNNLLLTHSLLDSFWRF